MGGSERRLFSIGWVLVSYFMVCGGIVAASIGLLATEAPAQARVLPYLAFGAGGLVGGFFAGRASAHRSILEPAVAGALVVGSIVLLLARTAVGPILYSFAQDQVWPAAFGLGGATFVGALVGGVLGELTASGEPSGSRLRWAPLTVLITAGALFGCFVVTNVLLADRALNDPELFMKVWSQAPILERQEVQRAFYVALTAAAAIGGFMAQAAAPSRQFLAVPLGVFAAYAAMFLSILHLGEALDREAVWGTLIIAAGAGLLGLLGAALAWILLRFRKR